MYMLIKKMLKTNFKHKLENKLNRTVFPNGLLVKPTTWVNGKPDYTKGKQ